MSSIEFIARAVFRKDGEILLAHKIGESNTFLPGGHIELEEYAKEALSSARGWALRSVIS